MWGNFDENDTDSFYYSDLTFATAREILQPEEQGVFLVRNSSRAGRYVICLKEGNDVSQYPVEASPQDGHMFVREEHPFKDLPSLISFYKRNLFATSALIRPVSRDKVYAPPSPTGQNRHTVIGSETYGPVETRPLNATLGASRPRVSAPPAMDGPPVYARVVKERIPISYETSALPLHVGDVIRITRRRDGRGYGEITNSGKKGDFPLTHVELIENFEATNK